LNKFFNRKFYENFKYLIISNLNAINIKKFIFTSISDQYNYKTHLSFRYLSSEISNWNLDNFFTKFIEIYPILHDVKFDIYLKNFNFQNLYIILKFLLYNNNINFKYL